VRTILAGGTSADRQLRVFKQTGDMRKVVDLLVDETAGTGSREPQTAG